MEKTRKSLASGINKPEPKWIEKIYVEEEGEDFLGLRSVQANITEYLLPGIITTTDRARYYSFYSWLLHEYKENHPNSLTLAKFIKRRERIFALANLVFDREGGYGKGTASLFGTRKLNRVLDSVGGKKRIPLSTEDYIQATMGGYAQYSGIMRSLQIIKDSDEAIELLPKAKLLAESFEKAIAGTKYYKQRFMFDETDTIDRDVLLEYGEKCYLSGLANSHERQVVLDVLFGFDAKIYLPKPESAIPTFGNMSLSLGLILDMIYQSKTPFDNQEFRRFIMYSSCSDFKEYRPAYTFVQVLSHWRMFQLREHYVHAIYEMWIFFLDVLKTQGPVSFQQFIKCVDDIDISTLRSPLKFRKNSKFSSIRVAALIQTIFQQSGIDTKQIDAGYIQFANQFSVIINEEEIERERNADEASQEQDLLSALLTLISIFLRLKGIFKLGETSSWFWAQEGGARRRSMELFMYQLDQYISEDKSLLEMLEWIFRDYVVAQHTITALEKWRQREVNTFHFSNDNGLYECRRMDHNTYTAARFVQAYSMIVDLGLVKFDSEDVPKLTKIGKDTLRRVMESANG
jgi:hypothetical protein